MLHRVSIKDRTMKPDDTVHVELGCIPDLFSTSAQLHECPGSPTSLEDQQDSEELRLCFTVGPHTMRSEYQVGSKFGPFIITLTSSLYGGVPKAYLNTGSLLCNT